MSPRLAGASLIAASLVAGVGAGSLLSDGRWSIAAALILTLATVGMGVGVLWMLRPSWADKTWPPGVAVRSDAVQARRGARVVGFMLLAPLPLVVALAVWTVLSGELLWGQLAVMAFVAIFYGGAGVALLRVGWAGKASSRASHSEHPKGVEFAASDREGWTPLGPRVSPWMRLAALGPAGVVFAILPVQLLLIFDEAPWSLAVWAVILALAAVAGFVVLRRAGPRVQVHVAAQRVRAGNREASWSKITSAEVTATPAWEGAPRTLLLTLHDGNGLRAPILLRRREDLTLTRAETIIVAEIIDASSIELPRAKEDPRGRFSQQLYPNHVTKPEARALATEPPSMNDALPVPR